MSPFLPRSRAQERAEPILHLRDGRPAFTLIEVLVSVTIGMFLAVLATTTFFQVRQVMRRTQARLELHNTARFIYSTLQSDLGAMMQEGAFFLESTADSYSPPAVPTHTGEVRLFFLRGRFNNDDITPEVQGSVDNTDLVWTEWAWKQGRHSLYTGSTKPTRSFYVTTHWLDPSGKYDFGAGPTQFAWGYGNSTFYENMPQPRRLAGPSAQATLDDNRFGSNTVDDIGDWTDLQRQIAPLFPQVTDMVIQIVRGDGSTSTANSSTTSTFAIDGVCTNNQVDASLAQRSRPKLIRVLVSLTDFTNDLTQKFTFSFPAPGMLPKTP